MAAGRNYRGSSNESGIWRVLECTGNAIFDAMDVVAHPADALANLPVPKLTVRIGGRGANSKKQQQKQQQQQRERERKRGGKAASTLQAKGNPFGYWLRFARRRVSSSLRSAGFRTLARKIAGSQRSQSQSRRRIGNGSRHHNKKDNTSSNKSERRRHAGGNKRKSRALDEEAAEPEEVENLAATPEEQQEVDWAQVSLPQALVAEDGDDDDDDDVSLDAFADEEHSHGESFDIEVQLEKEDEQPSASSAQKVADLESELSALRAQIAAVMAAQQQQPTAAGVGGGAGGTASFASANPNPVHFHSPAPPAPAPPAAPPAPTFAALSSTPVAQKRRAFGAVLDANSPQQRPGSGGKKPSTSTSGFILCDDDEDLDAENSFSDAAVMHAPLVVGATLSDIAGGAARNALRKVEEERSPGGTPMRRRTGPSRAVSTQDMIANALHKKFASVHANASSNVRRHGSPAMHNVHAEETWDDSEDYDLW